MKSSRTIQTLLVTICGAVGVLFAPAARAQTPPKVEPKGITNEDYNVYNAVLDEVRLPKQGDVLVIDDTLDFECGATPQLPILLNGCSPMIMPPNTPDTINQLLVQSWPKMDKQTWDDFEKANSASFKLRDAFVTSCKHELTGEDIKSDTKNSDSPNGAFYFSRVGFNPKKTEAIVFVFFASYIEHVRSTGDYFLLELTKKKKQWKLSGRVNEMETDGKGN
ncbi:MAG: hypothetical protein ACRD4H_07700 [Candidatus Acidiferrales bacterium]